MGVDFKIFESVSVAVLQFLASTIFEGYVSFGRINNIEGAQCLPLSRFRPTQLKPACLTLVSLSTRRRCLCRSCHTPPLAATGSLTA